MAQRFPQPTNQESSRFDLIPEFVNRMRCPAKGKARAKSLTIQDARIGAVFLDLPRGFGQRLNSCAGQFIFPADENTFGEQLAHLGDHFGCRFEADGQRAERLAILGELQLSP
jgi:hypothetical protein